MATRKAQIRPCWPRVRILLRGFTRDALMDEDDLLGRLVVGIQEEIDEQAFDRRWVVADLVVTGGFGAAQFQPVQRGRTHQRRAVRSLRSQLAGQHRQHRIMAQFVMVVQILIAERDAT
jgi:hypothetical protein